MTEQLPALRDVLAPQSFDQAVRFAQMVAKTAFAPQAFRGKPDDCLAAITYGAELGLSPMQALRGVAVINGVPAVYGDTLLAICQSHPQWGGKEEWLEGEKDARVAHCVVKRRGESDVTATFSVDDAKAANLWDKQGPWQQYPDRMLKMRARSFALRDQFADALRGVVAVEEAEDHPHIGPDKAKDVTPVRKKQPEAAPTYVELTDAWGQVYPLQPGEVEQWLKDAIDGADAAELAELAARNPDRPDVQAAVAAALGREPAQDERGAAATPPTAPEPPAPAVASQTAAAGASWKQRCEAIAAVFRAEQTLDGLNKQEARFREEMNQMPEKAKVRLAEIFHECREGFSGGSFDADIAPLENLEWQTEEGRVDDPRQEELLK